MTKFQASKYLNSGHELQEKNVYQAIQNKCFVSKLCFLDLEMQNYIVSIPLF
jgi:hypothetical protein